MGIVLRKEKGSELTIAELDGNFAELLALAPTVEKAVSNKVGTTDSSLSISVLNVATANLTGVDLSLPIAYIKIKGVVNQLAGDGYGNIVDDGYGTPVVTEKVFDKIFGISVSDDGYGNYTVANAWQSNLNQQSGASEAVYSIPQSSEILKSFFELTVSIIPAIDLEEKGVTLNIEIG